MSNSIKLDGKADALLSRLQDTTLTPMEEALFRAWTKANQIDKPDDPNDRVDYRGIFQMTGGKILPNGQLKRYADNLNAEDKLKQVLQERVMEHMQNTVDSVQDRKDQAHKDERQDIMHGQKMEMEQLKMKRLPHDVKLKQMDLHKQKMGLTSQELGNKAKELDITKSLVAPQPSVTTGNPKEPQK